jgi:hypothetical protein
VHPPIVDEWDKNDDDNTWKDTRMMISFISIKKKLKDTKVLQYSTGHLFDEYFALNFFKSKVKYDHEDSCSYEM